METEKVWGWVKKVGTEKRVLMEKKKSGTGKRVGTDIQWWEQTNMLWINNQSGDNEIGWEGKNGELSEAKQTVSVAS